MKRIGVLLACALVVAWVEVPASEACPADDPAACLAAGNQALVERRTSDALAAWNTGCASGSNDACFHFAHHSASRPEHADRRAEVLADFDARCAANDAVACMHLGNLKAAQAPEESARLLARACELNHANGCVSAGARAEMAGDTKAARTGYDKACKLGSAYACQRLKQLR